MSPTLGPQIPAHAITTSASKFPLLVLTPVTFPSDCKISKTSCRSKNLAPREIANLPIASSALSAFAKPSVGTCKAPIIAFSSSRG